jgi:hypothetical protein
MASPVGVSAESPRKVAQRSVDTLFGLFSQLPQPVRNDRSTNLNATMLARWSGWSQERVVPAARTFHAFGSTLQAAAIIQQGGKPMSDAHGRRLVDQRAAALEALDPLVGAGLERRRGSFIEPTFGGFTDGRAVESVEQWLAGQALIACLPAFHDDQYLWLWIDMVLSTLATRGSRKLRVCEGCSIVFPPARKKRAPVRYCKLCRHGRPAPILSAKILRRLEAPGATETVRVPFPHNGHEVARWRRRTVGRCSVCAQPFVASKGNAKTHAACRSRLTAFGVASPDSGVGDPGPPILQMG